jgi:hypothetical protein
MNTPPALVQNPDGGWPSAGLVVVAPGGQSAAGAVALAALLGLRQLSADPLDANAAMAELAQQPPGWLLTLAADPGADLEAGGCWAEALAAWRQPVLLLLPAEQASAGPARAYAALLEAMAVPLVGLLQLGEPWQPERRRADGLPWLGWLPSGATDEQPALECRIQLLSRWRLIAARVAAPAHPAA